MSLIERCFIQFLDILIDLKILTLKGKARYFIPFSGFLK